MRYVLGLLLSLIAADALASWCYGERVFPADPCPARITGVSVLSSASNGGTIEYTLSGAATVEVFVQAGANQACPGCRYATPANDEQRAINLARLNEEYLADGTGASYSTQEVRGAAGTYTIMVSDAALASQTTYSVWLHAQQADGAYYEAVRVNLTTASAGGDELSGAMRLIGSGGSDLADGLTHANRWASLSAASGGGFADGTDVWLLAATTFDNQWLTVNWEGVDSSDPVKIGCYYDDAGTSRQCTNAQTRPEINGKWEACGDANPVSCTYNMLPGPFSGLITAHVDDLWVEYIAFKDSEGAGIASEGSKEVGDDGNIDRATVLNSTFTHIAGSAIYFVTDHRFPVVQGNTVDMAADAERAQVQGRLGTEAFYASHPSQGSGQPACMTMALSGSMYGLIEGNKVTRGKCEAINTSRSNFAWIRDNQTAGTGIGIYGNHTEGLIVENNIVIGNRTVDNFWVAANQGGAIQFSAEQSGINSRYGSDNNLVRNNLLLNATTALGANSCGSPDASYRLDLFVYGNTVIGADGFSVFLQSSCASWYRDIQFHNNLIWSSEATETSDTASVVDSATYNHFTSTPTASLNGTGTSTGSPQITAVLATVEDLDYTDLPIDKTDYYVAGASPAANSGALVTLPAGVTSNIQSANWARAKLFAQGGYLSGCGGDLYEGVSRDFDCVVRDASPNKGAFEATQ